MCAMQTGPQAAPRANHVREKRVKEIMRAAEHEFARNGFNGTSVQAIADECGLQKRQVLYFFQNKEALYREVIENIFLKWRSLNKIDWSGSPQEVISAYIDNLFEQAHRNPQMNKLIMSEMLSGGKHGIEVMRRRDSHQVFSQAVAFLEGCMARGEMRRTDPAGFIFQIWSAQHFYVAFAPEVAFFLHKPTLDTGDWREFAARTKEFALSYFRDPGPSGDAR